MDTKLTQSQKKKIPTLGPTKIEDHVPLRKWDLGVDTKFTQYLNVSNIEALYQRINLVNLNHVEEKDYMYLKGSLDALYAILGVDTPLKRVLTRSLDELNEDRLISYIKTVTSDITSGYFLRKNTISEMKRASKEPEAQLITHILERIDKEDDEEGIDG